MLVVPLLLSFAATLCAAPARTAAWTLSTADTRLTLAVADGRPVITRLESTHAPGNWAGGGLPVPLMAKVWLDGREYATDWALEDAARDRQAGTLTLTFASDDPKLTLRSIWRARPGPGPVEHWMELDNHSGERVTVSHQDSLSLLGLRPGGPATVWWIRRGAGNASTQGGTFAEPVTPELNLALTSNCEDGASPVPWMAVQVAETRGLYVGWEFSGIGRLEAKAAENGEALAVSVGLNPDFRTDIEPGERFLVPPAFVGCYAGDVDEGSYRLHRFVNEKLRPPAPKHFPDPPLICGLYFDVGGANAREADVLQVAERFRRMGMDLFALDAMWFPHVGDWRFDPARFPNGAAPIEQYVHGHGMKLGLWCAWTNGGLSEDPGALSVAGPVRRPEWFRADYGPDWRPGPFYGGQLCLGCPEAKEWAVRETQRLVSEYKLDYLKHDIGPIVTTCNKTTHRHHYGVDVSYWAALGYYEVQEKLRQACPDIVLENCSGAGHIKDFGVIQRTHYTVVTDTLSALPNRQGLYDSTFALPPLVLQAYTTDNVFAPRGDDPEPYLWRSAMMAAWEIGPAYSARWTEDQRAAVLQAAEVYRDWIRPLFRDVKVLHILPRPDGAHWDGMFYWSPRLERGMAFIFRPEAQESRQTVRLKGLAQDKEYWVWCEDGSVSSGVRTGETLMTEGLPVRLPQQYSSDLIYVQDALLGRPEGLALPSAFALRAAKAEPGPFAVQAKLTWQPSAHARSYRVVVARTADFREPIVQRTVVTPSATLAKLPPGESLYWKVMAVSWGGTCWNSGGPGRLIVPPLEPLPGVTFVSDMPWVRESAGADNPVRRDVNLYQTTITIGGRPYQKGVWTHAFNDATPADVTVDLTGGDFATFAAEVGLDDAAHGGSVQFQVLVDGALRAESPALTPGAAHPLRVDVTGAREVTLRVLNGGDGYVCDHAAWGFARFLEAGANDLPGASGD